MGKINPYISQINAGIDEDYAVLVKAGLPDTPENKKCFIAQACLHISEFYNLGQVDGIAQADEIIKAGATAVISYGDAKRPKQIEDALETILSSYKITKPKKERTGVI